MRWKGVTDDLATRQHGIVTRGQLLDAGWHPSRIDRERQAGRLLAIHAGVYAVGHRAIGDRGRWLAGALACRGTLALHSAAALWELGLGDNGLTRVIARAGHRRARVDVRRADLHPRDRAVRHGIPVTTVPRTLADLAHVLDDERLHRVVKEAQFKGLWTDGAAADALTRRPSARLRAYLGDPTVTQSTLEDRFLRLCRRYGIPQPLTQHGVRPRVDFTWPDRRLVVEVDGWEAHRTRVAFQDDRANTNLLQLRGNVVLRYTWDDVRVRHAHVADQVRYAGNLWSTQSGPSSSRRYGRPPTRT